MTALIKACYFGKTDCTKLLLEKGAEVDAKSRVRPSPLACLAWWPVARGSCVWVLPRAVGRTAGPRS